MKQLFHLEDLIGKSIVRTEKFYRHKKYRTVGLIFDDHTFCLISTTRPVEDLGLELNHFAIADLQDLHNLGLINEAELEIRLKIRAREQNQHKIAVLQRSIEENQAKLSALQEQYGDD